MSNELKVGQQVCAPVSDAEGEVQYRYGTLLSINSRFAKIEVEGEGTITVGKSKVEAVPAKAQPKTTVKPKAEAKQGTINASKYDYAAVRAASGRKSLDNGDALALQLRGKTLDEAYTLAAEALNVNVESLLKQYGHLNAGMQRMGLGNRLRKK